MPMKATQSESMNELSLEEDSPRSLNVYQRIHKVMEETAGPIQKRGENTAQGYHYLTESDVIDRVRPSLLRNRLVFVFSTEQFQTDMSNGIMIITASCKFINIDNPSDVHEFKTIGAGCDMTRNGPREKMAYKALTGLIKYAEAKTLHLQTTDDPEVPREEEFHAAKELAPPPALPGGPPAQARVQPVARPLGPPPSPMPAPQVNGGLAIDPDPSAADIAALLDSLPNTPPPAEAPPPEPEADPNIAWAKNMQRSAEDAVSSDDVMKVWNGSKTPLLQLRTAAPGLYAQLHEAFRVRKDALKAQGR